MSFLRTLALAAPLVAAYLAVDATLRPFDEKTEVPKARKEIDAKAAKFNKAIWESDTDELENILAESFWLQYAEYGRDDSDDSEDFDDFISAVEDGSAPYAIQKSFSDSSTKVDRKVTSFSAGRTIALMTTVETHSQRFEDEDGTYGAKGKEHMMEVKVTWTDMWGYEVKGDEEKMDWYLNYRECSGAEIKVDGKPIARDGSMPKPAVRAYLN